MVIDRQRLVDNLALVREDIGAACDRAGRDPSTVLLVAAAKTMPAEPVRWAIEEGVRAIGQNYVKELRMLRDQVPPVRWHFIGTLQTNTAHHVASLADVVETLSSERATARLARRAAEQDRTLDALIEVDFTGSRSGVPPEELEGFADRIAGLEGIDLRGLMTLPPPTPTAEGARPWFARLRALRDRVRDSHPDVVELSMGMSLDYRAAVEEGATMVRIGTALFGSRAPRSSGRK